MTNTYMRRMQDSIRDRDCTLARNNAIKKHSKNPLSQYIVFGIILLVLQFVQWLGREIGLSIIPSSFITALGSTIIYAIVAVGFCLLLGYSGLASLGTAGFIGIGVYVTYYGLAEWNIPYLAILLISLAISIVLGVAVGFISLRIEGIYLAIITLGLSEILRSALQAIMSSVSLKLNQIKLFFVVIDDSVAFYLMVVTLIVLMWITNNLMNSPTGRAMLAMKNSTSAAQAYGISLMKYRLLAFVISTCYAAIAGVMYMMYIRTVSTSVSTLFTLSTSLNILGAVIIGGYRSIWGALVGVFIMYGMKNMFLQDIAFFNQNPTLITLFTGLLIILVVMYLPGGLAQLVAQLRVKLRIKLAKWRARKYG